MKELNSFIENIVEGKENYKLGNPWKYSTKSMGVIIPILKTKLNNRDYTTLPEVKGKVEFEDTGSIENVQIKGIDLPLFIRAGTILEGIGTQSRSPTHSIIVEPKVNTNIDVRCVHASHGISSGSGFRYGGTVPINVTRSLHTENQSNVWDNVRSYREKKIKGYQSRMGSSGSPMFLAVLSGEIGGIASDNLIKTKKKIQELDTTLQDILKQVPVLENQVGAIIVGMKGVVGLESFDHPDSWKAQYKEVIEKYSDELAENTKLFAFDDKEIGGVVKSFLNKISDANITEVHSKKTYSINFKGYLGEFVKLNNHIVHLFIMETENDNEVQVKQSQPRFYDRPIGAVRVANIGITKEPVVFSKSQFDKLTTKGMKKGYKEIVDIMGDKGGSATWGDLKIGFEKRKMSTATLSQRLKEGKDIGIFGEDLQQNGRKVYTMYKEE